MSRRGAIAFVLFPAAGDSPGRQRHYSGKKFKRETDFQALGEEIFSQPESGSSHPTGLGYRVGLTNFNGISPPLPEAFTIGCHNPLRIACSVGPSQVGNARDFSTRCSVDMHSADVARETSSRKQARKAAVQAAFRRERLRLASLARRSKRAAHKMRLPLRRWTTITLPRTTGTPMIRCAQRPSK